MTYYLVKIMSISKYQGSLSGTAQTLPDGWKIAEQFYCITLEQATKLVKERLEAPKMFGATIRIVDFIPDGAGYTTEGLQND